MHVLSKCKECYIMSCHSIVCYANCHHCGLPEMADRYWFLCSGFCVFSSTRSAVERSTSPILPLFFLLLLLFRLITMDVSLSLQNRMLYFIFYFFTWGIGELNLLTDSSQLRQKGKYINTPIRTYNTIHKKD